MQPTPPRPRRGGILFFGITTLLTLATAGAARSGEAYYLVMLASQRTPNDPNYSHTFATFVRTFWEGDGPCVGPVSLEALTISWLPDNGVVRLHALLPECGRNYGLDETIRLALRDKERVSLWGPYQVEPDLYYRALRQIAVLNSGQVQYKANDTCRHSDRVSNCIHAVSTVADGPKLRVLSPGWGEVASYAVLLRLEPWVIDATRTHDWLAPALGLDAYPIIYRDWVLPLSGTFLGPINRLFGGDRDLCPTYGPPQR